MDQMSDLSNMIHGAKLKCCPFCGNPAVRVQSLRYPNSVLEPYLAYSIMCANESCIMHQTEKFYFTEESAQIAWNNRFVKGEEQ